jgi:predicted anti-sigma-YlaC factor YlaD
MKCEEVTAFADLGKKPQSLWNWIRYYAHVSHCTACRAYIRMSQLISDVARRQIKKFSSRSSQQELEALNKNLLEKFAKSS